MLLLLLLMVLLMCDLQHVQRSGSALIASGYAAQKKLTAFWCFLFLLLPGTDVLLADR